ncbi:hypothetical protein BV898_17761 [Hypsibius exemplaris]|uniref:Ubiquitin-like domain-containing protein n=1 Tax=Hypsibius exemplaris TaxID=2072580 RepID=A0A9X6NG39_HYPEX|nr:hypothetical protein BV898_17761 [Hypsibius exemplaris]
MIVNVKTLMGKTFPLEVCPSDSVYTVKRYLMDELNRTVTPSELHLVKDGKELEDARLVRDYNLKDGASMFLIIPVRRIWRTIPYLHIPPSQPPPLRSGTAPWQRSPRPRPAPSSNKVHSTYVCIFTLLCVFTGIGPMIVGAISYDCDIIVMIGAFVFEPVHPV